MTHAEPAPTRSDSPGTPDFRVDGSQGEGGGQIVRSSMAIAAVTGASIEMTQVRARRQPPGLKAQHLTAVKAAAAICDGELTGADVGSSSFQMWPGALRGGEHHFDIGTAGSTMLVLQTVLPALLFADRPSQVELTGGTYNTMAPSWEYVERVYLPMLRRMGADVSIELHRRGFYPAGGGRVTLNVMPSELRPIEVLERGQLRRRSAIAVCGKLPRSIGEREVSVITRSLQWKNSESEVYVDDDTISPGNSAMAELEYDNVRELITEHGKRGLPAEKVAKRVVRDVRRYIDAEAPVGEHLADQLMTPMALIAWHRGGVSRFCTGELSLHARTLIQLLPQLLPIRIDVDPEDGENVLTIGPCMRADRTHISPPTADPKAHE